MLSHSLQFALAAAAVALLAGCVAEVKPITTPNGRAGFVVSCDGGEQDWDACYNAAADACDGKYTILDRYHNTERTPSGPKLRRYLVAECGRARR
ncbi:hypothetical protein [Massilia sp. Root351]|uniref:hypothetical protein n=1 Tax=Massilia sp. Root351 TaxID=1736522 RepID=UPI0012F6F282|nr:hypothetical protein [Massilia sp. Root351]